MRRTEAAHAVLLRTSIAVGMLLSLAASLHGFSSLPVSAGSCRPLLAFEELSSRAAMPLAMADADESVLRGREALNRWFEYPWYDAQKDDIRRIDVVPTTRREPLDLPWLRWMAYFILAVLLGGLAYLLIRAYLGLDARHIKLPEQLPAKRSRYDVERLESLPFMKRRSHDDLLGQARRHYQEGNYAEAIIYLFSHELVELDRHGIVRLDRGKTNRQYLHEATRRSSLGAVIESTMVAFEDVFFGGHALERIRFEACWNRLAEFEHGLAEQPA